MTYGDYPDLSSVKRILIIKLRHLGDVLLTTPVFSSLKKACPNAKIDAYIYKESTPILDGHPDVDTILENDRSWKKLPLLKKIQKEISLLRKIRKNKYDLIINLTEGDRGDIVTRFSKASIRLGFEHDHKGFFKKKKLYTHLAKVCGPPRHTVERNLDAVRRLGVFPPQDQRELFYHIPDVAFAKVEQTLKAKGFDDFILIHPTSRWRFKCWSVNKMHRLIETLLIRGEKVVITAGKDDFERQMVDQILNGLDPSLVLNLTGQVTLKELGAFISKSKLLICVDSVPLHLASALKAPVAVLFGPTSNVTWGPWKNPYARIITQKLSCQPCFLDGCGGSKVSDCLETIALKKVLQTYEDLKGVSSSAQNMKARGLQKDCRF